MDPAARIMIVDDNPSNIEICREILDGEFEVVTAADGLEAIRIASENSPRVVLLDVMLPLIDGYETCRRLRRLPGMQGAFIVFLSAKAMPSERAEGLDAGADAYLTKPFNDSELLSVVRSGGSRHHDGRTWIEPCSGQGAPSPFPPPSGKRTDS